MERHLPLVEHVARSVCARVPRHVPVDDLRSAGMLGLAEAARSFDPSRGVPFECHATTRIRGAMVDELRRLDWASRSVRRRARLLEERADALTSTLGRSPSAGELAEHVGLELTEVQRIREQVQRGWLLHYDADAACDDGRDVLPPGGAALDEGLVERERTGYLRDAVAALPDRLRFVVEASFFWGRRMQEIADDLGVTESRVSQLRAEALVLLRDGMNSQLDPERLPAHPAGSLVARRRAVYYAAIASRSDYRTRLGSQAPASPPGIGPEPGRLSGGSAGVPRRRLDRAQKIA